VSVITLITDFGTKDHYVGSVEAAHISEHSYLNFPIGSIHIIGVDSEKTPEQNHLVIKLDGHYFICAEKSININVHNELPTTFSLLDVFVKIAAHIYRGGSIDLVGNKIEKLKELYNINPILNEKTNEIIGNVIYVDNYENVVTNITKKIFQEFRNSSKLLNLIQKLLDLT